MALGLGPVIRPLSAIGSQASQAPEMGSVCCFQESVLIKQQILFPRTWVAWVCGEPYAWRTPHVANTRLVIGLRVGPWKTRPPSMPPPSSRPHFPPRRSPPRPWSAAVTVVTVKLLVFVGSPTHLLIMTHLISMGKYFLRFKPTIYNLCSNLYIAFRMPLPGILCKWMLRTSLGLQSSVTLNNKVYQWITRWNSKLPYYHYLQSGELQFFHLHNGTGKIK